MTNIFITEKTQRLIRVMSENGPAQAQDLARACSMLRAAEMLGKHQDLGGVETEADMYSMLVLLDIAQQCNAVSEKGKIAYFNANWDKVSPYWLDGQYSQSFLASELKLPAWVLTKVWDGEWNPNQSQAELQDVRSPEDSVTSKKVDSVRTVVDGKHGIEKAVNGSEVWYHWTKAPEGTKSGFATLAEAREAAGVNILHPVAAGHGQKTNDPAVSQSMRGK